MNAGRDVERMVSDWLVSEAAAGAPDRVLHETRRLVNSTGQRRFLAAWREPVYLSPLKLAAMAAALAVAVGGGFLIGRSTSSIGPAAAGASPAPTSAATTAPAATLESYRAARDEICIRYRPLINPLKLEVQDLYDPTLPASARATKTAALTTTANQLEALSSELAALVVPPELATEHRLNVSGYDGIVVLIRGALSKLAEGDIAGAAQLDASADAFNAGMAAFEMKYRLAICP